MAKSIFEDYFFLIINIKIIQKIKLNIKMLSNFEIFFF